MKLVFFDDFRLGAVMEGGVVDLSSLHADEPPLPHQLRLTSVIEHWDVWQERIADQVMSGEVRRLGEVRLRPPVPEPLNIVCMAVNYMEDGTRRSLPPKNAFLKNPRCVIGPEETLVLPDTPASIFEAEAEIALVIGRRAERVSADDALSHVFGYLNFLDGSARGPANDIGLPFHMKNHYTFAPLGPWLVTADEIADPQNLKVRQWNNGEPTQDYSTSDMAYDIAHSIEFVTSVTPLGPGDIIALGTNHLGLHPVQDGDRLEMEVDGLGRLAVDVRDPLGRTWERATRKQRMEAGQRGPAPQTGGKYAETGEK